MYSRSERVSGSILFETHCTRGLAATFLLSIAVMACSVALLAIGYRSVLAIGPEAAADCQSNCAASGTISSPITWEGAAQPETGPDVISPVDSALVGRTNGFGPVLPSPQPDSIDQPTGRSAMEY